MMLVTLASNLACCSSERLSKVLATYLLTRPLFEGASVFKASVETGVTLADSLSAKTLRLSKRKNVSLEQTGELLRNVLGESRVRKVEKRSPRNIFAERDPSSRTNSEKRAFVFSLTASKMN
jgi:hypothetical protein